MPLNIDKAKALRLDPFTVAVERGRLIAFARATGQADPTYTQLGAARDAGHPDLPVPPTFFFSLELEGPEPFGYLGELDVDLRRVLHGEQAFSYRELVHAGDTVTLRPRIADAFIKKGGALEFLIKTCDVLRDGKLVAQSTSTIVVQNPAAGR
jgi:hypothetical protein